MFAAFEVIEMEPLPLVHNKSAHTKQICQPTCPESKRRASPQLSRFMSLGADSASPIPATPGFLLGFRALGNFC